MFNPKQKSNFWIGNSILALSAVMLFFMGPLSEHLGMWAMLLWMGIAGVGMYFVTRDKGPDSNIPD